MPQVFAYLRVSTDDQDTANQKTGVVAYCIERQFLAPAFVEDTSSGRKSWRDRPLGALIGRCQAGDVLVVAEISRLGFQAGTAENSVVCDRDPPAGRLTTDATVELLAAV